MNSIAIMQPYLYPYITYYAMVARVDTFYLFDDVNFIKKGWINRNRIRSKENEIRFSVPLVNVSQNRLIQDTEIDYNQSWQKSLLGSVTQCYSKSPFFDEIFPTIEKTIQTKYRFISELCEDSIISLLSIMGFTPKVLRTSTLVYDRSLKGQEKIMEICKLAGASSYFNLPGGRELYQPDKFKSLSVELNFMTNSLPDVFKFDGTSIKPDHSLIDVLFSCGLEQTSQVIRRIGEMK